MSGLTASPDKFLLSFYLMKWTKLYFHIGNCNFFKLLLVFRSGPLPNFSLSSPLYLKLSVSRKTTLSLICLLEKDEICAIGIFEISHNDMPWISWSACRWFSRAMEGGAEQKIDLYGGPWTSENVGVVGGTTGRVKLGLFLLWRRRDGEEMAPRSEAPTELLRRIEAQHCNLVSFSVFLHSKVLYLENIKRKYSL